MLSAPGLSTEGASGMSPSLAPTQCLRRRVQVEQEVPPVLEEMLEINYQFLKNAQDNRLCKNHSSQVITVKEI